MFADRAKIFIRSGKGGDGHVSFRRELFVAAGGPDGGDGGNGGDLILEIDPGLNTLYEYRHKTKFHAGDGEEGGKRRCHGKNGEDLVLKVPEGTLVREAESGKVVVDMSGENRRVVLLTGGHGGKGNMNYATATMQVPQYAQPGQPAKELLVQLELKLIADVGLVGYPNVGKSTFLSRVTNATPKIGNYHFTTLSPNLGIVDLPGCDSFVIADIPGLIEGAAKGAGLGHEFLRHIERTRVLIHMVDAASTEGRDPVEDIRTIREELKAYNPALLELPQVIAANKTDVFYGEEKETVIEKIREEFAPENIPVYAISAVSGEGVKELLFAVKKMLEEQGKKPLIYESEYNPQEELLYSQEPYTVTQEEPHVFVVEGPKIEKMLGYTNLDSEKGFEYFQNFLKKSGILEKLEELGVEEGDTIRMYGLQFDYYR